MIEGQTILVLIVGRIWQCIVLYILAIMRIDTDVKIIRFEAIQVLCNVTLKFLFIIVSPTMFLEWNSPEITLPNQRCCRKLIEKERLTITSLPRKSGRLTMKPRD